MARAGRYSENRSTRRTWLIDRTLHHLDSREGGQKIDDYFFLAKTRQATPPNEKRIPDQAGTGACNQWRLGTESETSLICFFFASSISFESVSRDMRSDIRMTFETLALEILRGSVWNYSFSYAARTSYRCEESYRLIF